MTAYNDTHQSPSARRIVSISKDKTNDDDEEADTPADSPVGLGSRMKNKESMLSELDGISTSRLDSHRLMVDGMNRPSDRDTSNLRSAQFSTQRQVPKAVITVQDKVPGYSKRSSVG